MALPLSKPLSVLAYSVSRYLGLQGLFLFELKVFPLGKNLIAFLSLPP
jgi:hypothetical protein